MAVLIIPSNEFGTGLIMGFISMGRGFVGTGIFKEGPFRKLFFPVSMELSIFLITCPRRLPLRSIFAASLPSSVIVVSWVFKLSLSSASILVGVSIIGFSCCGYTDPMAKLVMIIAVNKILKYFILFASVLFFLKSLSL